ncbi:MAG: endolytic transglycosylase MltG [Smithella sp.]
MNKSDKKNLNKSIKKSNSTDINKRQEDSWIKRIFLFSFFKKSSFTGRTIRRVILYFIVVFFVFCVFLLNYSISSIDKKNINVLVDIPTGSSFLEVTEKLNQAGLIKNRIFFYSLAMIKKARRRICAGEYEINTLLTPSMMIDKLIHGEVKEHIILIPEDFSMQEIVARLDNEKLINKEIFFELARDKDFLKSLNIKAESIEGYLFPDTYYFNRSMNTRQIMKKMVDRFWEKVTPEMIKKAQELGFNTHQFITIASIIGKESGDDAEKPFIAAVFLNRLKKKMRLQSDPTAVYDMDSFNGKVLRSHLKRNSPYNTYLIRGLPPGPIANPGLTSLQAALNPAPVKYLYFVSKKDGSHFFSDSLKEHNKAIYRYAHINNK